MNVAPSVYKTGNPPGDALQFHSGDRANCALRSEGSRHSPVRSSFTSRSLTIQTRECLLRVQFLAARELHMLRIRAKIPVIPIANRTDHFSCKPNACSIRMPSSPHLSVTDWGKDGSQFETYFPEANGLFCSCFSCLSLRFSFRLCLGFFFCSLFPLSLLPLPAIVASFVGLCKACTLLHSNFTSHLRNS